MHYQIDPARVGYELTGIYVRATDGGKWRAADIAELTDESLTVWVDERGASAVVLALLTQLREQARRSGWWQSALAPGGEGC